VAWTSEEARTGSGPPDTPRSTRRARARRTWHWWLPLVAAGLTLSACSLHISKHGVSGNLFGHSFSGASGQLPSGFPSDVPVPDNSRVLLGGGTDNDWDVGFAVTGSLTSGTTAYQSKMQSAGYTISNVQSGSTPDTGASNPSPSTTVTLTGSTFTAKNSQWTVEVVSGTTSSAKSGPLKAGEFAINITVVPVTSSPPST
jgi:hypothetical protein